MNSCIFGNGSRFLISFMSVIAVKDANSFHRGGETVFQRFRSV